MGEKQVIPLRILGYNGKFDSKVAPPGVMSNAENVQAFRRSGEGSVELRKRYGFTEITGGKSIDGGGSIAAAVMGAAYGDELVLCDGLKLYSRSDVFAKWESKGKAQTVAADSYTVSGSLLYKPNTDIAYQDGYACYVASGNGATGSTATIIVKDMTTGTIVMSSPISAPVGKARVLGLSSSFYVFTWEPASTKLRCRRIQTSAPSTLGAAVDVATDMGGTVDYGYGSVASGVFDVAVDTTATRMWVAYGNTGDDLVILSWTTANAAGVGPSTYTGINPNVAIGFIAQDFSGGSGYVLVSSYTTAGGTTTSKVNLITFATASGAETADTNLETYSGASPYQSVASQLSGYRASSVNNSFWTLRYRDATASGVTIGSRTSIQAKSGASSVFTACLSVGLASRLFNVGAKWYFGACYEDFTSRQRRLFLFEIDENAASHTGSPLSIAGFLMSNDCAGEPTSFSCLSSVPKPTATTAIMAAPGVFNVAGPDAQASTEHYSVNSISLNFAGSGLGVPVEYNGLLHLPIAAHKTYDGVDVVEAGFYVDPEAPTLEGVAAGEGNGALTPGATYQYCATWARTDSRGRLHRSAPGPIAEITLLDDPDPDVAENAADVTIQNLRVTETDPRYNVNASVSESRIEIWRTEADLDIFYLLTILENDATTDVFNFEDSTTSDEFLTSNEILYTASEELDNQKPPAVKVLRPFQGRLFALTGDGSTWHSKESAEGFGAEFSDEFRILSDGDAGRPTTLGSIDTLFFIFKRKRAYFTQGPGPDDKGAGSPFPRPQPLEIDLGVINATGAIDTPGGIMCETATGRFLLNRSLSFEPIEGTENQSVTVVGGVGVDTRSMTVFVTGGSLLVRDWQLGQWFVWSKATNGLAGVAIVRWRNQLCVFQSDGTVLREIASQFFDAVSTAIAMTAEFSFVRLENCRLHQCRIVGEIMGSTTLTETVTYDGNDATAASKTKAVTVAGDKEDLNVIPNRGRAASVKFKLSESSTTEGFRLSMVGLEVALKTGLAKVASGRNFT